jgi:hypothetical protein
MGRGPAVATIEKRMSDVDAALADNARQQERALDAYDQLPRAELQKRYALQFSSDGLRTRGQILGTMAQKETYADAELAIRAFLAFLFLALLVLKIFQPRSVSVYFSETLQDLHAQYRAGSFDHWLSAEERSGRGGMKPLRFEEWCLKSYRSIRNEDEQKRRVGELVASRKMREDELTRVRSAVETECDPVRRNCETAASTLHELQAAAQKIAGEVESTKEKIGAQQQLLMAMEANIQSGGLSGDAFVQAVAARGTMERALSELQRVAREQEGAQQALSRKVQAQQKRVNDAETQLESRESVLRQVEQQLMKLRSETTAAIASLQL